MTDIYEILPGDVLDREATLPALLYKGIGDPFVEFFENFQKWPADSRSGDVVAFRFNWPPCFSKSSSRKRIRVGRIGLFRKK